jgi:hypothetical protein
MVDAGRLQILKTGDKQLTGSTPVPTIILRGDWRWSQHGLINRKNVGSIPTPATKIKST